MGGGWSLKNGGPCILRALVVGGAYRQYQSPEYPKTSEESITQGLPLSRRCGTAEGPMSPWGWERGTEWDERVGSIRTHKRRMIRTFHRPGAHKHPERPPPVPRPTIATP